MSEITEPGQAKFSLVQCLVRLSMLRREPLDVPYLRSIMQNVSLESPNETIKDITQRLHVATPRFLKKPDASYCPLLAYNAGDWVIVTGRKPNNNWSVLEISLEKGDFVEVEVADFETAAHFYRISLGQKFLGNKSPSLRMVISEVFAEKRSVFEIVAATALISMVALVASIYSMQVYDRVVPTSASATLYVLTLGALFAAMMDTVAKWIRSHQLTLISDRVDQRLARSVFSRFLGVRLDVMPNSVGAMAQRLRSYEGVRTLILTAMTNIIVDIPLAILLASVLFLIGGYLVLIPVSFLIIGILISLAVSRKIDFIAKQALPAHNQKTGHLVESVEGAEIIKSGSGGWRMLAKWLDLSDQARTLDREMKDNSDNFQFLVGFFQQISYTLLIAFGALAVSSGSVTMGGMIACSILSGRILTPLASLPNMIVQWGSTKASLQELDRFWRLEQDVADDSEPLYVKNVRGEFELFEVEVEYDSVKVLSVNHLKILPGESVAILGAVGSGKTTLLRALTGLYKPQAGRVLLDSMNIFDIDKHVLAQNIAFVPQDGRLFSGTVRENLLVGLDDLGDEVCLNIARRSGLYQSVLAPHPKGLARAIHEGGSGLSGGQRQLVHITRAMLRNPRIWLLDEPTASMDSQTEHKVIEALNEYQRSFSGATFIFVTHKPQVVALAKRVIVMNQGKIVLDGPREEVLMRLQAKVGAVKNAAVSA